MNIGILAVDSTFPNLSTYEDKRISQEAGRHCDWYTPFEHYDKLYMAKVFSFTQDYLQHITNTDCIEKGGTGYDITKVLPLEIDRMQPDLQSLSSDR